MGNETVLTEEQRRVLGQEYTELRRRYGLLPDPKTLKSHPKRHLFIGIRDTTVDRLNAVTDEIAVLEGLPKVMKENPHDGARILELMKMFHHQPSKK